MNSYDVLKSLYPITTTPKEGVNVRELVKATFPKEYNEAAKAFTSAFISILN